MGTDREVGGEKDSCLGLAGLSEIAEGERAKWYSAAPTKKNGMIEI